MPATSFVCPSGGSIAIKDCLDKCPNGTRCMFKTTLTAVANSQKRDMGMPTVTEILTGTREAYLKRTKEYAVNPMDQVFALFGTGVHKAHEDFKGNNLGEIRIFDEELGVSGKPDILGNIVFDGNSLGDYKVIGSYAMARALGYRREEVETGEVFKTGLRKGMPKTKKVWREDGVKHLMPYALQLNIYRLLLERQGHQVDSMFIEFICRDYGLQVARERNIKAPVKVIEVNKISNHWLEKFIKIKVARLNEALQNNELPEVCRSSERWGDRKCMSYCAVRDACSYAVGLKENNVAVEAA